MIHCTSQTKIKMKIDSVSEQKLDKSANLGNLREFKRKMKDLYKKWLKNDLKLLHIELN